MSSYDEALTRHLRKVEENRSDADKLRVRLDYAKRLRRKADEVKRLAEWLNSRIQQRRVVLNVEYADQGREKVVLKRSWRYGWHVLFGPNRINLSVDQMEALFTWAFDDEKKLRAHADEIEKELTARG